MLSRKTLIIIFLCIEILVAFPLVWGYKHNSIGPYGGAYITVVLLPVHVFSWILFMIAAFITVRGKVSTALYILTLGIYFIVNLSLIYILFDGAV